MSIKFFQPVFAPEGEGTGAPADVGQVTAPDTGALAGGVENNDLAIEQDFDMEMLAQVVESAPVEDLEQNAPVGQPSQTAPAVAGTVQTQVQDPAAAAQPPQTAQVQQQPAQQPETQVAPGTQGVPADPFSLISQAIEQGRTQVIDAIADQVYKLSPEMTEALATEPEKVVPKLLANVHVNAVQGVMRHVAQQMPVMIAGMMQAQQVNTQREEAFFKAWPQLKREEHMSDIIRVGQVFKQLNPQATPEDFIRHVGAQVVIARGLYAQRQQQQTPVQQVQPQQQPFMPAGVGHAGRVQPQSQQMDPWAEFVEIMRE